MAANQQGSTKRLAISKANAQMVGVVAAASFVSVFCLVASQAVFSQNRYQARLIVAKEKAHHQLEQNTQAFNNLKRSYTIFNSLQTNVIGGSVNGTGDNDGPNSKIILDALPDSYDFPALISSLEKILGDNNVKVSSITGTDDQLNQQNNVSSPNPEPVSMNFSFTVTDANYTSMSQLFARLQQSIRPIQIDSIDLSGGANSMTATVNAHTFYQPTTSVSITKQVVK